MRVVSFSILSITLLSGLAVGADPTAQEDDGITNPHQVEQNLADDTPTDAPSTSPPDGANEEGTDEEESSSESPTTTPPESSPSESPDRSKKRLDAEVRRSEADLKKFREAEERYWLPAQGQHFCSNDDKWPTICTDSRCCTCPTGQVAREVSMVKGPTSWVPTQLLNQWVCTCSRAVLRPTPQGEFCGCMSSTEEKQMLPDGQAICVATRTPPVIQRRSTLNLAASPQADITCAGRGCEDDHRVTPTEEGGVTDLTKIAIAGVVVMICLASAGLYMSSSNENTEIEQELLRYHKKKSSDKPRKMAEDNSGSDEEMRLGQIGQ
jgi:hypothetical protein